MNLVERAKRMLLTPKTEWEVVDAEPTTPAELYTQYIIPLAAIGPIARVIGFALIGVFVLAMIIDMLAPTFGGTTNRLQALKVSAYSHTAAWLAAIFAIIPGLSILGILGLYSLYLLYLGLPVLMKAPQDRAGAYTIVVILVAIVLFFIIGVVGSRVMMGGMY